MIFQCVMRSALHSCDKSSKQHWSITKVQEVKHPKQLPAREMFLCGVPSCAQTSASFHQRRERTQGRAMANSKYRHWNLIMCLLYLFIDHPQKWNTHAAAMCGQICQIWRKHTADCRCGGGAANCPLVNAANITIIPMHAIL